MRCAHCGHLAPFRVLFRFRADGGYRCVACQKVFYVVAVKARLRSIFINLLVMAAFVIGLFQLLRLELFSFWIAAIWAIAFCLAFAVTSYFAMSGARTATSMPAKVLWRRRCFNYGMPFFAAGQLLGFLSKPYVPTDDWSHYISITGSVIFFLFILAGFARPMRELAGQQAQ